MSELSGSETGARFVRACLRCVGVDLCRFSGGIESGVDSDGRRGTGDGACAARHARRAEASRLAFAAFFRCAVRRGRWIKRYWPAGCDLLAVAADFRIKRAGASVEPHVVFRGRIERFLQRAVRAWWRETGSRDSRSLL